MDGGSTRPKVVWQDWLNIAAILLAVALAAAEDRLFLLIYTLLATCCFLTGIWAHKELSNKSRVIVSILVGVIIITLDVRQFKTIETKELASSYGNLIPAGEPQPLSTCPVPENAVAVYAGKNVVWTTRFPFIIFILHGTNLLVLDRDNEGHLLVTAQIFDDRGNLTAKIESNKYVSTNYASRFSRADRSSLTVFDHLDEIALGIRFVNEHAVRVVGKFHAASGPTIVVSETSMDVIGSGNKFSDSCSGDPRYAGFVFD